jgi:Spy/CpxP family protein refolding chaperone
MKVRPLFLLPTVLLLVQVGNAIAAAQIHSMPVLLLAQLSPPALAPNQANEIPAPPWARNLNLSAEQRSRLKTVNQQARNQGETLHQQLMAAEKQLRSRLQSNASIDQLRQQHQEVQKLRQQLDNNHFEALLGERQVLTSEQLAKVIQEFQAIQEFRNRP